MKNLSLKIDDVLHAQITQKAADVGLSLADAVREAIRAYNTQSTREVTGGNGNQKEHIDDLRAQVRVKDTQITELGEQIKVLTQELSDSRHASDEASKRHDTIILTLTQQLKEAHLQLEDLRHRKTWWQKLVGQ